MKKLVINKLTIISQRNEEAKVIEFDKKLTVITGENPDGTALNRTGKSLVMKSIYHSLGANIRKYTSNWSNLKICTIINFTYNDKEYSLYRNNDSFLLNNEGNIKFFKNVSDLRKFYVEFFNFKIRMKIKEGDSSSVYAFPGAIFMPYYIDQDKGWSGSWDSFSDVFSGKWKTEVLLYHMGVRTPIYYDLLDEKIEIAQELQESRTQEKTLNSILINHTQKYKDYLDINVNLNNFTKEISEFTKELNKQLDKRNSIKEELINCYNEIREFEELYSIVEKVYNELLNDVDYVENNLPEDIIICPTCGTQHENSIQNKFHIYSEIEECEETMRTYFEERSKLEKKVQKQSDELDALEEYIYKIEEILNKKRDNLTFKEIVVSEGSKSILNDIREELNKVESSINDMEQRLKKISAEQSKITREGKAITDLYLEKLKENLLSLNVIDIDEKDLKKFKPSFNSGGNDLPCAILAQVYALYSVSSKYSLTVISPIVLDAIFQQEPAKEKVTIIWDFVINNQPKDSQLIISTTETHNRNIKGKVIQLNKEMGLLNREDYKKEKSYIDKYKNELLKWFKKDMDN